MYSGMSYVNMEHPERRRGLPQRRARSARDASCRVEIGGGKGKMGGSEDHAVSYQNHTGLARRSGGYKSCGSVAVERFERDRVRVSGIWNLEFGLQLTRSATPSAAAVCGRLAIGYETGRSSRRHAQVPAVQLPTSIASRSATSSVRCSRGLSLQRVSEGVVAGVYVAMMLYSLAAGAVGAALRACRTAIPARDEIADVGVRDVERDFDALDARGAGGDGERRLTPEAAVSGIGGPGRRPPRSGYRGGVELASPTVEASDVRSRHGPARAASISLHRLAASSAPRLDAASNVRLRSWCRRRSARAARPLGPTAPSA